MGPVPTRTVDQGEVTNLVIAQGLIQARLAEQAVANARRRIASFQGWYDNAAVTNLAKEIAQAVTGAQKVAAQVTDAYVTRVSGLVTGKTIGAAGQIDVSRLRKGTTPERAYARLAKEYRFLVSEKRPVEQALTAVQSRASAMIHTDVQLADRQQWTESFRKQGITGYRRILHPELSHVTGTCGLCIAAADREYHVDRLMPIHVGCHCGVLPITDAHDPGLQLNKEDLGRLYAAAGGTERDKLKRVHYNIHQHGELGPILTNQQYDWRTPKDVAA